MSEGTIRDTYNSNKGANEGLEGNDIDQLNGSIIV
jgi:hypothetical protein